MAYIDERGNVIGLDTAYQIDNSQSLNAEASPFDAIYDDKTAKNKRAAELKRKKLYRKGELQYEDDGSLIHDSNAMIRAKEVANAGIKGLDWLIESTENVADFGQGDWIDHYTGFKAENQGRRYSMDNKDFIAARDTTTDQLAADYHSATHNPNADKGIYTLKKFDGYDDAGSEKFLYKYGLADVGADTRYRDQYVQDGFEIVEEKRFAGAEDWEKAWNASEGVLNERTLDNSFDLVTGSDGTMMTRDEASGINFGAGKTELLNSDLLGTDVGKTQADYDANRKYSQLLSTERDEEEWHDNSVWGRSKNTLAGFSSMLTKSLIVDTADWIGEGIFGGEGVGTEEEKRKWTQELFGYDEHFSVENMAEIEGYVGNMMKDGLNWEDIKGALGSAIANVETTGESLGYLVGLVAGVGKFTKVGKLMKDVNTLEKTSVKLGGLSKKVADAQRAKIMKNATLAEKASYRLGQQAGLINSTAGMTNDHIDAFTENNNGVAPSGGEITFMFANNLVALATDRFTDLNVLKHAGILKTTAQSIKDIAKESLPSVANKIMATTASLASNMGKEFAQEYYQTLSEQVNKQWGTDKYGNSLMTILSSDENQLDALVGGVAGVGGAVHFQAVGATPGIVSTGLKTLTERAQRKPWEKAVKNVKSFADVENTTDLKSQDIADMTVDEILNDGGKRLSDYDTGSSKSFKKAIELMVAARFRNIKGEQKSKQFFEKEYTKNVLNKALKAALAENQNGNVKPLNSVLKTIKMLNDDKDFNFLSSELQEDFNENLGAKISEIMAKDYTLEKQVKDIDLDTKLNKEEQERLKEMMASKMKENDLKSLGKQMNASALMEVMMRQGSTLDINGTPIEVNDDIVASEKDLTIPKLQALVQEYAKAGWKKSSKAVKDEILKFGFISEDYDKVTKKKILKLEPSQARYAKELVSRFKSTNSIKNVLTDSSGTGKVASLAKFVNWAETRFTKLVPKVNKDGITNRKSTADYLWLMEPENEWFAQQIELYESLLESHEVGENKLPAETKAKIQEQLNIAKESLANATLQVAKHKAEIIKFVEEKLGFDGIDFQNAAHVRALKGISTDLGLDKDGNEVFGKTDTTITDKFLDGNTKERAYRLTLDSKQQMLEKLGLKTNKYYVNYINKKKPKPVTGTGSPRSGTKKVYTTYTQNETSYKESDVKKEYKTGFKEKQTYIKPSETISKELQTAIDKISEVSTRSDKEMVRTINESLIQIKLVLETFKDISKDDKIRIEANIKNVLNNFKKSIEKDIIEIESAYTVYKDIKDAKKRQTSKALAEIRRLIKSLTSKMKALLGYAQKSIVDKNLKQKLVDDLTEIESAFKGSGTRASILEMIDAKISMNKALIDFAEKLKAEVVSGKIKIDSTRRNTTTSFFKLEYKEFYDKIVSDYKKFKSGTRKEVFKDAVKKGNTVLKDIWNYAKSEDNKDRYADLIPSEVIKAAAKDMKKDNLDEVVNVDTDEDIAEQNRVYEENKKQEEAEQNDVIMLDEIEFSEEDKNTLEGFENTNEEQLTELNIEEKTNKELEDQAIASIKNELKDC